MVKANTAFERDCVTREVTPKRYHADNDTYAENAFKDDCRGKLQSLTLYGAGAHWQNGIAEKRIKHLTLDGRTMLIDAHHCCPEYITTMVWLFVLLAAVGP